MNIKTLIIATIASCLVLVGITSQASWWPFSNEREEFEANSAEITEVYWDDLIPDDFVQPENPFATMSQEEIDILLDGSDESNARLEQLEKDFYYAPVKTELDGIRVKIPAYITPLDFDGNTKLKEFLLVPYMGACIHTPPPPANQVVHAQSPELLVVDSVYDPVWVIGTIHTETVKSNLAEAGYRLDVEKLYPYTGEEQ